MGAIATAKALPCNTTRKQRIKQTTNEQFANISLNRTTAARYKERGRKARDRNAASNHPHWKGQCKWLP
jgi:hypothetical protein